MVLHSALSGSDLHDPKGKYPTYLVLGTNTAAYQIQNASTRSVFNINTTGDEITIGNGTDSTELTVTGNITGAALTATSYLISSGYLSLQGTASDIRLYKITTPPSSTSNYGKIYTYETGGVVELYYVSGGGTVQITSGGYLNVGSGTPGASWTINNDDLAASAEASYLILLSSSGTVLYTNRLASGTDGAFTLYTTATATEASTTLNIGVSGTTAAASITPTIYLNGTTSGSAAYQVGLQGSYNSSDSRDALSIIGTNVLSFPTGSVNGTTDSLVIGGGNHASTLADSSIVIGKTASSTVTSGSRAQNVVIGNSASAVNSSDCVVIGYSAQAPTTASQYSTAVGRSSSAAGNYSTALGGGAATIGDGGTAVGYLANCGGTGGIALGYSAAASANQLAIGSASATGLISSMVTTINAGGDLWTTGYVSESKSLPSGATQTTTITIPANAIIKAVLAKVTTTITGATTWSLGRTSGGSATEFGNALALTSGTKNTSAMLSAAGTVNTSSTTLTITANGSNFTGGVIRISIIYETPTIT